MNAEEIVISLQPDFLPRLDRALPELRMNREKFALLALQEKLESFEHQALMRECGKLDPREEQAMAEESFTLHAAEWPEY